MESDDQFEKARAAAHRYLSLSARSSSDMRSRLQRGGIDPSLIDVILSELETSGLIDDNRFIKDWVEDRADRKRYGRTRLMSELQRHGISKEIMEEVLPPLVRDEELQRARNAVSRKWPSDCLENMTFAEKQREKQRCASFLQRRGFDWEIVMQVLDDMK